MVSALWQHLHEACILTNFKRYTSSCNSPHTNSCWQTMVHSPSTNYGAQSRYDTQTCSLPLRPMCTLALLMTLPKKLAAIYFWIEIMEQCDLKTACYRTWRAVVNPARVSNLAVSATATAIVLNWSPGWYVSHHSLLGAYRKIGWAFIQGKDRGIVVCLYRLHAIGEAKVTGLLRWCRHLVMQSLTRCA